MRVELNKIDAMGFDDPEAPVMVEQLRDLPLPEKMEVVQHVPAVQHLNGGFQHISESSFIPPPEQFPDFSQFHDSQFSQFSDFPFNAAFDAHKLRPDIDENDVEKIQFSTAGLREYAARDYSGNSIDINKDKPHLYTPDPYEQPNHYAPEP